jgi:hypothetical protein
MTPETLDRFVPAVIGLAAWGAPSAYLARLVWLAHVSRRWPSTRGRIVTSRVRNSDYYLGDSRQFHRVRYEYEVDGRVYVGHRVRFGDWLSSQPKQAARIVSRYRVGDVTVRYDPRRPHVSTLDRQVSKLVWLFLGIGILQVGAIFGALMGWWE